MQLFVWILSLKNGYRRTWKTELENVADRADRASPSISLRSMRNPANGASHNRKDCPPSCVDS